MRANKITFLYLQDVEVDVFGKTFHISVDYYPAGDLIFNESWNPVYDHIHEETIRREKDYAFLKKEEGKAKRAVKKIAEEEWKRQRK